MVNKPRKSSARPKRIEVDKDGNVAAHIPLPLPPDSTAFANRVYVRRDSEGVRFVAFTQDELPIFHMAVLETVWHRQLVAANREFLAKYHELKTGEIPIDPIEGAPEVPPPPALMANAFRASRHAEEAALAIYLVDAHQPAQLKADHSYEPFVQILGNVPMASRLLIGLLRFAENEVNSNLRQL